MEKAKKQKGKHYFLYLVSYMIVLFIPLSIISLAFSARFITKFYDEVFETVDMELQQIGYQIDAETNQMKATVARLSIDGTMGNALRSSTPLAYLPVINYLSIIVSANSFYDDIILFLNSNDYIATSSTTWQKDYFYSHNFSNTELAKSLFEQDLSKSQGPRYATSDQMGMKNGKKTVFFILPVFTDYLEYRGNIVFSVDLNSIQSILSTKLQSYDARIFLFDSFQNLIFSSGKGEIPDYLDSGKEVKTDSGTYIIRRYKSTENGWSYYAVISKNQSSFSQVASISNEFSMTIIITLLIACLVILVIQKMNYTPILRLSEKAKLLSPQQLTNNEFTNIANAIDYLTNKSDSLRTKLEANMSAIKNERLSRLISGNYQDFEEFNTDCADLDLLLPFDHVTIVVIMLHGQTDDMESIAYGLKTRASSMRFYYCLNNYTPNQMVLLVNSTDKEDIPENMRSIQEYIQNEYGLKSTIGIGSMTNNTEKISQSYMEAISALDYRFIKGNGTIIGFKEAIGNNNPELLYPKREFELLGNALLSKNEEKIQEAIDSIIKILDTQKPPLYLARSICFDLMHIVGKNYAGQDKSRYPFELSGLETAQEIISMLEDWRKKLKPKASSNTASSMKEIMKYLDENCLKCSFSVFEAAENFNMTLPAFSKFFKDNTGKNVIDYTTSIRIQKAKDLLENTDIPISEIAEQIGYYNLSSFTRRFKINQGISPTEYRNNSRTQH